MKLKWYPFTITLQWEQVKSIETLLLCQFPIQLRRASAEDQPYLLYITHSHLHCSISSLHFISKSIDQRDTITLKWLQWSSWLSVPIKQWKRDSLVIQRVTLRVFLNDLYWIQLSQWIKTGQVTGDSTCLATDTLPVTVIQITFPLLHLVRYLLPLTALDRYLTRDSRTLMILKNSLSPRINRAWLYKDLKIWDFR